MKTKNEIEQITKVNIGRAANECSCKINLSQPLSFYQIKDDKYNNLVTRITKKINTNNNIPFFTTGNDIVEYFYRNQIE